MTALVIAKADVPFPRGRPPDHLQNFSSSASSFQASTTSTTRAHQPPPPTAGIGNIHDITSLTAQARPRTNQPPKMQQQHGSRPWSLHVHLYAVPACTRCRRLEVSRADGEKSVLDGRSDVVSILLAQKCPCMSAANMGASIQLCGRPNFRQCAQSSLSSATSLQPVGFWFCGFLSCGHRSENGELSIQLVSLERSAAQLSAPPSHVTVTHCTSMYTSNTPLSL